MSDGPHRSLPMRRPWRDLAERAWSPAWSPGEVEETLCVALKAEFRETPLGEVARILEGDGQRLLFPEARATELEAIRNANPGSSATGTLIDCAIEVDANGVQGEAAARLTVENALEAVARDGCRQIVEHCQRGEHNSGDVRSRLRTARGKVDFNGLAAELLSDGPAVGSLRLPKRQGVDEGPPL